MKFRRKTLIAAAVLGSALLSLPMTTAAQNYPSKPVRLIVPDAAGGSPDILGRILAQKLSESLGQQVIVDNRPGAAGLLAAELAARAAPDGYTLFMSTTSVWAILPSVKKNLPYDAANGFMPITRIASASNVMVINPSLPANSVADLVKLIKASPGTINYASAGIATPAHLAGEMLNLLADIKMTHVPYRGAGPALLDVIAGSVQVIITSPIAAGGHIKNGKVRALATTGPQRNPGLPDLPTVSDSVPGYDISQSWGITVPVGTPATIVKTLHTEIVKALNTPEIRKALDDGGAESVGNNPAEFAAIVAADVERYAKLVKISGAKPD